MNWPQPNPPPFHADDEGRAAENTNTTDAARPVWLTREQVEALNSRAVMSDPAAFAAAGVFDAWHAAPADPAEAVYQVFRDQTPLAQSSCDLAAADVLVALGLRRQDNTTQ